MIDTTAIKRYYLRYWVDRSQAARKAAEELAKKEARPSLRDKYNAVMTLNGKRVEFKSENEKKADGDIYFTHEEAMKFFGAPELNDGWRLPTEEEFEALRDNYSYEFKDKQGVFDNRLYLPLAGYRTSAGNVHFNVGTVGGYWSSELADNENAWFLSLSSSGTGYFYCSRDFGFTVRLVRNINKKK